MWNNPATQEAVGKLRSWGRRVMEPDTGELATRHVGVGRFPQVERIMGEIRDLLEIPQLYAGKRVLITAGPTREPLDPVRYISNRSSGRMGFALAEAAQDMGADVTLISGPVDQDPVPGCRVVGTETAEAMLAAVEQEIPGQDLLIMAAAVADFQPAKVEEQKIPRSEKLAAITLKPTPDIIKAVRQQFPGTVVAFALQSGDALEPARNKLRDKGVDYLIVNRYDEPGAGFEVETNHVWVLSAAGEEMEIELGSKAEIARKILSYLAGKRI